MTTATRSNARDDHLASRLARAARAAGDDRITDRVVVELRGKIDAGSASSLRRRLLDIVADHDGRSFVFDVRRVTIAGNAGVAVLVVVERAVRRRGGRLTFVGLSPRERRRLRVAGLPDDHIAP